MTEFVGLISQAIDGVLVDGFRFSTLSLQDKASLRLIQN